MIVLLQAGIDVLERMAAKAVRRDWLVIGGGVSGISCVGQLLSHGFTVAWIDPYFAVGRMGKFYRTVPANTPNHVLCSALLDCKDFDVKRYLANKRHAGDYTMFDMPSDGYSNLGELVLPLEHATVHMQSQDSVATIRGYVQNVYLDHANQTWSSEAMCSDGTRANIVANAVVAATGSSPTKWQLSLPHAQHELDMMLCTERCRQVVLDKGGVDSQSWAVVGSSHRYGKRVVRVCMFLTSLYIRMLQQRHAGGQKSARCWSKICC